MSAASLSYAKKKKPLSIRLHQQWPTLVMLAPSLVLIFIFGTLPLVGLYMAFSKYRIATGFAGIFQGPFVGLHNFIRFFQNTQDMGMLFENTLVVNSLSIVTSTVLSIVFAIMLKEIKARPFAKVIQTVSFIPFFISWVIAYSLVVSLFAVQSGAVNQALISLGFIKNGYDILGDPKYSWGLSIILNIWKNLGYNSILYLSAMNGIGAELYEAASMDGAGRFRRIWHVTLPGIIPTFCILLILAVGNLFNSGIDYFFVFQNSMNWTKMYMFDMYIYNYGLKLNDFSYSTAVGILKSIVSIALLIGANFTTRKLTDSSIF